MLNFKAEVLNRALRHLLAKTPLRTTTLTLPAVVLLFFTCSWATPTITLPDAALAGSCGKASIKHHQATSVNRGAGCQLIGQVNPLFVGWFSVCR